MAIYLDHAATTPLDRAVLAAMEPYLLEHFGNASSVHGRGRQARVAVEEARERVAAALGAEPSEVVFTSGGTESDNLALKGALRARAADGRTRLVTSAAEHEAVLQPAEQLAAEGYEATVLAPDAHGRITPDRLDEALDDRVALVSLMHANNEIGTLHDIAALADVCHAHGAWLHCDAVQTAGLMALNVKDLGADLLSLSAHKLYGPKGVGALYVRGGIDLPPLVAGGAQERNRRGGTENTPGVVGLAEALTRAVERAPERVARLESLQQRLVEGLTDALDHFRFNTPVHHGPVAPHIVNISFPPHAGQPIDGEMLLLNLDMHGVQASAGSACTSGALEPSHVLTALGLPRETAAAAVRFSLGKDTSPEDVDGAVDTLADTIDRMRR
ncbi:cysteine desulfurase family protein [Salisaeta longa]|uniref:cysteine desulfurase family protein n=1 Tax=Salisaeta longa TaxID=503170 RepID=UPI0003B7865F|nr:cysteine desulfurase family protein [Salisaeta longa]